MERPHRRVSIHAPRAGRDETGLRATATVTKFQSTRPVRGATGSLPSFSVKWYAFQSTRPVRGATVQNAYQGFAKQFQSTRPVRGATTRQ